MSNFYPASANASASALTASMITSGTTIDLTQINDAQFAYSYASGSSVYFKPVEEPCRIMGSEGLDGNRKLFANKLIDVSPESELTILMLNTFKPFLRNTLCKVNVNNESLDEYCINNKVRISQDCCLSLPIEWWKKGYKFMLAGGKMIDFVNEQSHQESTNDFDLFFTSKIYQEEFTKMLVEDRWNIREMPHLVEATKGEVKVQIVKSVFACIEEVLLSFDFRACSIGCDGENIYYVDGAFEDVKEKVIKFHSVPARRNTFPRIHKYMNKGYKIYPPDWGIASLGFLLSMEHSQDRDISFFINREEASCDATSNSYSDWLDNLVSFNF